MRWQTAVQTSCPGQLFVRARRPGWKDSELGGYRYNRETEMMRGTWREIRKKRGALGERREMGVTLAHSKAADLTDWVTFHSGMAPLINGC